MLKSGRFLTLMLGTVLGAFGADEAMAEFPNKAVEIIVPVAAGGATDLGARVIAKALQDKWKVPVKVVNLPGGNTVPAIDELMRAPPDGYKVFMDSPSSSSLLAHAVPNLQHKITDRTFVTMLLQTQMMFAVPANSPIKTFDDMMAVIKKDPAVVSWTSLGGTGMIDMAFRRLFKAAGVDVATTRAVVSKGGSEAAVQTAGGHVTIGAASFGSFASFMSAGKVRPLAIAAAKRSALAPDVPTTAELGYPAVLAVQWNGIAGPPNMAREAVAVWHSTVEQLLKDPAVIAGLAKVSIEPLSGTGAEMAKLIATETADMAQLFPAR